MRAMALFCPACAHRLMPVVDGIVVPSTNAPRVARFVFCLGCALVSEVSDSGMLIDLGRLDLGDVAQPTQPDDDHHVPILALDAGRPLEGRRDS